VRTNNKRERNSRGGHVPRRHQNHNRYQQRRTSNNSHDVTTAPQNGSKDTPEVLAVAGAVGTGTAGRFTSFLVADILGIGCGYSSVDDVTLVTSSERHPHQQQQRQSKLSGDFRVERLIRSNDDISKTTSGM